jgi:hypothetical protein
MALRFQRIPPSARVVGGPLLMAFALLAVGDTAHVGLRLVALAAGNPELTATLGSWRLPLVGFGALVTAITVTGFYGLLLVSHRRLVSRPRGPLEQALLGVLLLRLLLLAFPQNAWNQVVPPQPWSLIRNLPLLALTLGVGWLYLRGSEGVEPRWPRRIGALLLASVLCYLPVVLWIQKIPLLGLSKPRTKCQTGGTLKVLSSTAIPGYCLMAGMGEMGSETSQPDSERLSP